MNVIFRSKNLERFNSLWNEFAANTVTSHRYLLEYKEYQKSYLGQEVKDHSFVIEENNRPVGIAPLILTKHNLEKTQVFLPAPFATSEKSRDQALIQIDEILKNESVGSYGLFIDCFTEPTCSWNYLKKFGYVECNEDVVFLDLKKSKEELWSQLRKSYKAIINSNLKNPDISFHFFEGETADFSSHEEYRELHHKCSGRITRSIESFKKQFELVTQGNGLFSGMKYKGNWVSFTYFLYKNDKAVYFSASDDPDVKDTSNVYHALLWQSFLYLKEKGFTTIDLGSPAAWHQCQGFSDYADKKQIGIAHFKRGMGGDMRTVFRGVKYFDKKVFLNDCKIFADKFTAAFDSKED